MGVPRYMVSLSLQLVIAQRLVRLLCPQCAAPHDPAAHESSWLRLALGHGREGAGGDASAPLRLRRAVGCDECNQTGFSGRAGVYEVLEMTQDLVDAVNDGDPSRFKEAGRRQMAGATLLRDAARLVAAGRTTVDEAMRVSSQSVE